MVDESFIAAAAPPCDTPPPVPDLQTTQELPPDKLSDLQHELSELKRSFAEYMHKDIPEMDRMRQELHNTACQRDNHAAELKKLKQSQALSTIAKDYSFNDIEYLEFVLQKNSVQTDDPQAVKAFMQQLKADKPRFFDLPLNPGAGSRPGKAPENIFTGKDLKRMDALEMMISHAREIV